MRYKDNSKGKSHVYENSQAQTRENRYGMALVLVCPLQYGG